MASQVLIKIVKNRKRSLGAREASFREARGTYQHYCANANRCKPLDLKISPGVWV